MMMIIIIISSNKFIIKRIVEMIKGVHNLSNSIISSQLYYLIKIYRCMKIN